MAEHEHIHVDRDGHVATVTINRPAAKNACTREMFWALGDIFREISFSGARVAVLTGAEGDFCAGADVKSGAFDPETKLHPLTALRLLGEAMTGVHNCAIPVIAKVDGVCVGAGFGLALAADVLWCSDRARFSAIFAKRGLSLDAGVSWLLRQRIGVHRAKQIAFSAEIIEAARAKEYGFVNEVVPVAELDTAVAEYAALVASGPPMALSMTKRQLDHAGSASLAQALEAEALAQTVNFGTEDMREAMTAFVERRPPNFEGR